MNVGVRSIAVGKPRPPECVRDRFPDCMCAACEPLLAAEAEAATSLARWREEHDPKPIGEAIDSVLSLLPGRIERRRWAVRALTVLRERNLEPEVTAGALRVPMEELPQALQQWLVQPENREVVEDLLDEAERERWLRLYDSDAA